MVGGLLCKKGVWNGVFDQGISHDEEEGEDEEDQAENTSEMVRKLSSSDDAIRIAIPTHGFPKTP